jgi:hypothetical protein
MGDLRPDNYDGSPPDDGRGGLPDLPPEWGTVVIPDDASELDAEATEIRRELRWSTRRARLHRFVRRSMRRRAAPLGIPVLIMAIAIITTLVSLFAVTWNHPATSPSPAHRDTGQLTTSLSEVRLTDTAGQPVRLGDLLPAIVLITDSCDCTALAQGLATAVPAGVHVVLVAPTARTIVSPPANLMALTDPDGSFQSAAYHRGTTTTATAVVVNHFGGVVRIVPNADDPADVNPLNPG